MQNSSRPSKPSGGSSGVKTVINSDGSTTTETVTVENTDGVVQLTVTTTEGTKAETTVAKDGVAETEVTVNVASDLDGDATADPPTSPRDAVSEGQAADTLTISTNGIAEEATVTITVTGAYAATVVAVINPDGTETILRDVIVDGTFMTLTVPDGTTLKLVNRDEAFVDVFADAYFGDATKFVASHDLFGGTSDTEFSPQEEMTRGMLAAVLHSLANTPEAGGDSGFGDVNDQYFAEAAA